MLEAGESAFNLLNGLLFSVGLRGLLFEIIELGIKYVADLVHQHYGTFHGVVVDPLKVVLVALAAKEHLENFNYDALLDHGPAVKFPHKVNV